MAPPSSGWKSGAGCSMLLASLGKKAFGHITKRAGFMKRRDFLKVTGIGAAGAATLAAPAIAQSMPEIKWRMTASWPKSLDTLWGAVEVMSKAVAEATDNMCRLQSV